MCIRDSKMIDDIEKESKDALEELSVNIRSYSDVSCDYIIEHGSKLEAVKNLISLDNSISLLILASNKKDKNPLIYSNSSSNINKVIERLMPINNDQLLFSKDFNI